MIDPGMVMQPCPSLPMLGSPTSNNLLLQTSLATTGLWVVGPPQPSPARHQYTPAHVGPVLGWLEPL